MKAIHIVALETKGLAVNRIRRKVHPQDLKGSFADMRNQRLLAVAAILLATCCALTSAKGRNYFEPGQVIPFQPITPEEYKAILDLSNGRAMISEARLIGSGLTAIKGIASNIKNGALTALNLTGLEPMYNSLFKPSSGSKYQGYPLCVIRTNRRSKSFNLDALHDDDLWNKPSYNDDDDEYEDNDNDDYSYGNNNNYNHGNNNNNNNNNYNHGSSNNNNNNYNHGSSNNNNNNNHNHGSSNNNNNYNHGSSNNNNYNHGNNNNNNYNHGSNGNNNNNNYHHGSSSNNNNNNYHNHNNNNNNNNNYDDDSSTPVVNCVVVLKRPSNSNSSPSYPSHRPSYYPHYPQYPSYPKTTTTTTSTTARPQNPHSPHHPHYPIYPYPIIPIPFPPHYPGYPGGPHGPNGQVTTTTRSTSTTRRPRPDYPYPYPPPYPHFPPGGGDWPSHPFERKHHYVGNGAKAVVYEADSSDGPETTDDIDADYGDEVGTSKQLRRFRKNHLKVIPVDKKNEN